MPLTVVCGLTGINDCAAIRLLWRNFTFMGGKLPRLHHSLKFLPAKSPRVYKFFTRAFARRKSVKKLRDGKSLNGAALQTTDESLSDQRELLSDGSPSDDNRVNTAQNTVNIASRETVLKACTLTSGLIAALGILIRQVSHVASMEGLPILDCSTEVSFCVEMWHSELIMGLVILISSCRYLLLKIWPDFCKSTDAANQQSLCYYPMMRACFAGFIDLLSWTFFQQPEILTSLQPLDYLVVSFFPGISEELLFRGALLPIFGMDWKSVLGAATLFGVLHLGNGRKYSFAVWATFVGFVYGYATIVSSSIVVPMASHALNNLVGGILWWQTSNSFIMWARSKRTCSTFVFNVPGFPLPTKSKRNKSVAVILFLIFSLIYVAEMKAEAVSDGLPFMVNTK